MPDDLVDKAAIREWREVGFYYDRDDEAKEWRLVGSVHGLLQFADLLSSYVDHPGNKTLSEHDHYGPYMYLEVMTWNEAGFDDHAIRGSLEELGALALLIRSKLLDAQVNSKVSIREEFAIASPYSLVLDVRGDDFDPASADPHLHRGFESR